MLLSPLCLKCSDREESISHLIFGYEFSKRVWRAFTFGSDFDFGTLLSIEERIRHQSNTQRLWIARNILIWEGKDSHLDSVLWDVLMRCGDSIF